MAISRRSLTEQTSVDRLSWMAAPSLARKRDEVSSPQISSIGPRGPAVFHCFYLHEYSVLNTLCHYGFINNPLVLASVPLCPTISRGSNRLLHQPSRPVNQSDIRNEPNILHWPGDRRNMGHRHRVLLIRPVAAEPDHGVC